MNLQWFASAEWALIVKALTHTLWQGTVLAVALGVLLRRCQSPLARYRCALAALAGVLAAGMLTWAWLNRSEPQPIAAQSAPAISVVSAPATESDDPVLVVNAERSKPVDARLGWTAWGALLWLAGATLMIGRAGFQVAGAERLRRSSHPLEDSRIAELLGEARNAVGLVRNVRMAVTDKLTSPAVVGVLVPTLILPLSLVSTLSHEQIRFILLHELAHIRRGDYFANLFQLFVEALLFFNPAVWWISRQVRIEREACCDALAIELSGAPADYARTLVRVAENVLQPAPVAAPAFGDKREPSSLADRVQRLLVPGYRPRLRLTWRAMVVALFVSGALLTLSAIGTRVTMAAILSPEQRMERIEKKMTEFGGSLKTYSEVEKMPPVSLSGHIRMADGAAIPKWTWVYLNSVVQNSSSGTSTAVRDGQFKCELRPGNLYLSAEVTNYAPAFIGPLDGFSTNRFANLELVFASGFKARIELLDAASGQPIAEGKLTARFSLRGNSGSAFRNHELLTDESGVAILDHAADLPLTVTANVPGYEILDQRFETVSSNTPLRVMLQPGAKVAGVVTDKNSGQPMARATVQIRYEKGPLERGYGWDDASREIAVTDSNGRFESSQLRKDTAYWLGISASGHESIVLSNVRVGQLSLKAELGPQIIVKGRITGDLSRLENAWGGKGGKALAYTVEDRTTENRCDYGERAEVRIVNGVGYFVFTNRYAANVVLHVPGQPESRFVSGPVDDWLVNLTNTVKTEAEDLPKREVVFRFNNASGVPARGAVRVDIPDSLEKNHRTAHSQEMTITNGVVRVNIAVGGWTSVEPLRMVGYWFDRWSVGKNGSSTVEVPNGSGPLIVDIPLISAGAIYARAKNADGTPAGGLFFGVDELKRAPGRGNNSLDGGSDSFSDNSPRKWISGPLPLGGTYQIHAWRGNAFCISQPIKLTEANPDAEVELQFPAGETFRGILQDAQGQPLRDTEVKVSFRLAENHGFGLKSVYTDAQGRFEIAEATPGLGTLSVEAQVPGVMAENVKLNFAKQPQVIRLKPGRTLGGQMFDAANGWPIPGMEVRALDYETDKLPMQTTHTDDDGRFLFSTLGDGNYTLYPDGGELLGRLASGNLKFRADGRTNLVLRVKLYDWIELKPKAPTTTVGAMESSSKPAVTFALKDPLPSHEMVEKILAAGVKSPTIFFYKTNGILFVRGTDEQLTLVNRLVLKLNGASNQEIEAGATQFPHNADMKRNEDSATNLFSRTYKVNGDIFDVELEGMQGLQSSNATVAEKAKSFFAALGVDWEKPQGKSVFFNDRLGKLFVKATPPDLDVIESALGALIQPNNYRFVAHALEQRSKADFLAEPEVVTSSGRNQNRIAMNNIIMNRPVADLVAEVKMGGFINESNQALDTLVAAGPSAMPELARLLLLGEPSYTQAKVAYVMGAIAYRHPNSAEVQRTVPVLISAAQSQHPAVRVYSVQALGAVGRGASNAVPLLIQLTKAPDDSLRMCAVEAIGRIGLNTPEARSALMAATSDSSSDVRVTATNALRAIETPTANGNSSEGPAAALTAKRLLEQGKLHFEMGNFDAAKVVLMQVLTLDSNNPTAKNYLSVIQSNSQPVGLTYTGPGRQGIFRKLSAIRLDRVEFKAVPLAEVLRTLAVEAKKRDTAQQGINFLINPYLEQVVDGFVRKIDPATGLLVETNAAPVEDVGALPITLSQTLTNASLADVLDAVVLGASKPIKYSVQDFAVVFSPWKPSVQLFSRTFAVNAQSLAAGLKRAGANLTDQTNSTTQIMAAFRKYLAGLGVDWEVPPGKSLFYSDGKERLFVKATTSDLDIIERAIDNVLPPPPQIHIKARFVEVPKEFLGKTGMFASLTNSPNGGFTGILTSTNAQFVLKALESRKDAMFLSEPEVTTLSGRQTQMRATAIQDVITGVSGEQQVEMPGVVVSNSINFKTEKVETGPILDATATVMADGYTISLRAKPSLTEFFGYASPKNPTPIYHPNAIILPEVRPSIRVREKTCLVNLYDGQTLVVGGFQSRISGEENLPKQNDKELLVFITATIIDPAGKRIYRDRSMPAIGDMPRMPAGIPPQPSQAIPGYYDDVNPNGHSTTTTQ